MSLDPRSEVGRGSPYLHPFHLTKLETLVCCFQASWCL